MASFYEEYKAGQLVLPRALLTHFGKIFGSADDFLVWLYLLSDGNAAPSEIAAAADRSITEVNASIDRLQSAGALRVDATQATLFDVGAAFGLLDASVEAATRSVEVATADSGADGVLAELTAAFEAEMGTISPIQIEEIRDWVVEEKFDPELIRAALREAVLNRKVSLNYIRAILRNWRNDGVTGAADIAERRTEREIAAESRQPADSSFYIPTEGPWDHAE